MTMDLSRIWDSEPNQPLKWLEWAPETPIRGPEGPKVASMVLNMWGSASNPFLVHQKIEKSKMLRIEFWTSDFDVEKCSKRPWDPHNRIRLEKLCPEVVSDRQKAGRMTSKSGQNGLGTLLIGFALKNYAQKWSQMSKCWTDALKTTILAFLSDH